MKRNSLNNFEVNINIIGFFIMLRIFDRDLAARNILIDEKKTLKISDFGLSRSGIYVNTRNKKVSGLKDYNTESRKTFCAQNA